MKPTSLCRITENCDPTSSRINLFDWLIARVQSRDQVPPPPFAMNASFLANISFSLKDMSCSRFPNIALHAKKKLFWLSSSVSILRQCGLLVAVVSLIPPYLPQHCLLKKMERDAVFCHIRGKIKIFCSFINWKHSIGRALVDCLE